MIPFGRIEGVTVRPLRQLCDERGKVMHMLRSDDPHFERFGEIYFSVVFPGVVKGWHLHTEMTLNYAVPVGRIKLVCYDDRDGSPTRGHVFEAFVGDDSYQLVTVPPGVWNGFKGISPEPAVVANCATTPHRAEEILRKDPFSAEIPYSWELRHG